MFKFHNWQIAVLGFTSAILFGLVGSYEFEDKLKEQALYCENVKGGVWPAYKKDESDKAVECK